MLGAATTILLILILAGLTAYRIVGKAASPNATLLADVMIACEDDDDGTPCHDPTNHNDSPA